MDQRSGIPSVPICCRRAAILGMILSTITVGIRFHPWTAEGIQRQLDVCAQMLMFIIWMGLPYYGAYSTIYHYGYDRAAQRFVAWALLLMYLETILIFVELNISQITAYGLLTMIIGPVIQWLTLLAVRLLHFLLSRL